MVAGRGKVPIVPSISIRKDFQRKKKAFKNISTFGWIRKRKAFKAHEWEKLLSDGGGMKSVKFRDEWVKSIA